jgi:hypothetical protein
MEQDNKKTMEALLCRTLRELVDTVNAKGIQKDDIVQVVSNNGNYALLYYK